MPVLSKVFALKPATFVILCVALLAGMAEARAVAPEDTKASVEEAVTEDVRAAVSEEVDRSLADRGTLVDVKRVSGGWAFGTAVVPAPKKKGEMPRGWLFVAESGSGGWKVGLEGERGFSTLAGDAPESVVGEEESAAFASTSGTRSTASTTSATNLALPYARGQAWTMTGGPHGWNGYDRPYSALDFSGGDGNVRSAGRGTVYSMCSRGNGGWLRVIHPNGFSTDYYHLEGEIQGNGQRIKRGVFLGRTGNDVSCGGGSTGAHVHFALREYETLSNGRYSAVHGKTLGGWTFREGSAYGGSAVRDTTVRRPGQSLVNYGIR